MYQHVYTLKGTERAGTFAEPSSICQSSSSTHIKNKQISSFFVSDITNHRIIKVVRTDSNLRANSNHKNTRTSTEWHCTVVSPYNHNYLSIPRGICAVPHSHSKHGMVKQAVNNDVIIIVDSGHNRIRALSVPANNNPIDHKSKIKDEDHIYVNVAGSGLKGNRDGNAFTATFNHPYASCFLKDGSLLVTDTRNHRVRRLQSDRTKLKQEHRNLKKKEEEDENNNTAILQFSPVAHTSTNRRHKNRVSTRSNANQSHPPKIPSLSCMLLQWSVKERKELSNSSSKSLRSSISVTTVAGGGGSSSSNKAGLKDGLRNGSLLKSPKGIACCPNSGVVVLCDSGNHCLRLLHPTKDSNEFYVSTLEVAEAKRKDHPQDKIQPFLIHNPSNVTVLNGDGTAEVIAVTHDHGISIVAIDVKSSVVLGCQSVAGRTRRQQEENVASEKLKRSQSASSTETKKPRPMFKSKSAVTATKLLFGYVDGVPSKSKFHLPTGILLGHNASLYICDSKNGSIRHLIHDNLQTMEKFWVQKAKSSPKRRKSYLMLPTKNTKFKKEVSLVLKTADELEREKEDALVQGLRDKQKKGTKKSIGSRLVHAWSTGKNVQDAYMNDIQQTFSKEDHKEEDNDKSSVKSHSSKTESNIYTIHEEGGVAVKKFSMSDLKMGNNNTNSSNRNPALSKSRGRQSEASRLRMKRCTSSSATSTNSSRLGNRKSNKAVKQTMGFGSSARCIGSDTLKFAKVQSPSKKNNSIHFSHDGSSNNGESESAMTVMGAFENENGKGRAMSVRFVGLGVSRSKLEKREAKKTIRRLSTMENKRRKSKTILLKGNGRTASKGKATGSNENVDGSINDKNVILELHPEQKKIKNLGSAKIFAMKIKSKAKILVGKHLVKHTIEEEFEKVMRHAESKANHLLHKYDTPASSKNVNTRSNIGFQSKMKPTSSWRQPKTPRSKQADHLRLRKLSMHGYPKIGSKSKLTTTTNNNNTNKKANVGASAVERRRKESRSQQSQQRTAGDRSMKKSDMDMDSPPRAPFTAASPASIPLPEASMNYTPSYMRTTTTSRRHSMTQSFKNKKCISAKGTRNKKTNNIEQQQQQEEEEEQEEQNINVESSVGRTGQEVIHINRNGQITVNTLGESGLHYIQNNNLLLSPGRSRSPQKEKDLMRLIGTAQAQAERLMLMIRNQI